MSAMTTNESLAQAAAEEQRIQNEIRHLRQVYLGTERDDAMSLTERALNAVIWHLWEKFMPRYGSTSSNPIARIIQLTSSGSPRVAAHARRVDGSTEDYPPSA